MPSMKMALEKYEIHKGSEMFYYVGNDELYGLNYNGERILCPILSEDVSTRVD
jgi:hypothetical protein